MLKKWALLIIKIISIIPFFKSGLKVFYIYGLNKLKRFKEIYPEIVDIIITSDTESKDFNYGQSDYNLLIILENNSKPKTLLKKIRRKIRSNIITNLVFHTLYIPIITIKESESNSLKAFLMRRDTKSTPHWASIYELPRLEIKNTPQSKYSSLHNSFQNLDYHLFRNLTAGSIRSKVKNIYRGLVLLNKHFPQVIQLKNQYHQLSLLLIKNPFLSKILFQRFHKESWGALNFYKNQLLREQKKVELPKDLSNHLQSLLQFDFIEDITLTPSVIQKNITKVRGKLFIEINVNELVLKSKYLKQLENLEEGILKLQSNRIKIRVKVITQNLLKLQLENYFFTFPMDTLYRNEEMISLKNFSYVASINKKVFIMSAVQFYISQFLRFRSLEQKTSLIGSKFIKSLNIMFRYYQLAHYLKHKEFLNYRTEEEIRAVLTPQFSEMEINDIVTDEHWALIRSQLLYTLKIIKKELVKSDRSLKDLNL